MFKLLLICAGLAVGSSAPCEQLCEDEFPQCINYQSSRIEGGCVAVYDQCSESQIRKPPRLYFFFSLNTPSLPFSPFVRLILEPLTFNFEGRSLVAPVPPPSTLLSLFLSFPFGLLVLTFVAPRRSLLSFRRRVGSQSLRWMAAPR